MAAIDRFILLVRSLRRGDSGMALPVALFAMIASVGLAGAAVIATVDVQRGSSHDSGSKSAIAAADAGANIAAMRMARYATDLASASCLVESGGTLITAPPEADGWCPPVAGSVGGATYTYRISPAGAKCGSFDLCVVSTGTLNGVSRRIEMTYNESTLAGSGGGTEETNGQAGTPGGGFEGLVGEGGITISGNADLRVGIGTNGEISGGNKGAIVCGDMRVGIGKAKPAVQQCSGYSVKNGNINLVPVTSFMPSNIKTVNANNHLRKCTSKNNPEGCQIDTFTGTWTTNTPLDPTPKAVAINGGALTVGGPDYWLCSLTLKGNSELIMAAGSKARFFFDTPANCGMKAGETQLYLSSTSRIVSTGYQPAIGKFDVPGFFLLGNGSVQLAGNQGTNELIVYGPDATINLSGNATYKGILAGEQINVTGSGVMEEDAGFELPAELRPPKPEEEETDPSVRGSRYYTAQSYVECTGPGTAPAAPNANC